MARSGFWSGKSLEFAIGLIFLQARQQKVKMTLPELPGTK
jgi:hypothetical protein